MTEVLIPKVQEKPVRIDACRLLRDSITLIDRGFCKRRMAANSVGETVGCLTDEAVAFDIMGALTRSALAQGYEGIPPEATSAIRAAMDEKDYDRLDTICGIIDREETTQADVLKLLDWTIRTVSRSSRSGEQAPQEAD